MIDASTVMRLIVHELGLKRTSQNGGITQQSVTRRSDCQSNLLVCDTAAATHGHAAAGKISML